MFKILIVDDSLTARVEVANILNKTGDFSVLEAADGEQAVEVASQEPDLDMIVCDYNMPGMDGIATLETILKDRPTDSVVCVMLTTESSPELKQRGKAIGVKGWMFKPLKPEKFIAGLKALLNKYKYSKVG